MNNESINEKTENELLKIKEKEYITQEELEKNFGLKKDKVLELRTKKELKYFQIVDKEKVLFKMLDVKKFTNKYTKNIMLFKSPYLWTFNQEIKYL